MWVADRNNRVLVQEYYIDPLTKKKKVISVTAKSKKKTDIKEAENKLTIKLEALNDTNYKLSDLIRFYMKHQHLLVDSGALRESSAINTKARLQFFISLLDDVYIDKLTAGYIKQKLIESGKEPDACNNYITYLKAMLKWCYENDFLKDRSLFDKLTKFPAPSEREKIQDKFLENDEIERLLNGITIEKYKFLTKFLLLSGLRIGEALALDWSDISDGYIHINKTFNNKTNTIEKGAKTDSSNRDVFIQKELAETIQEMRIYFKKQENIYKYPTPLYIWCDETGKRMSYWSFENYFTTVGKKTLGRSISAHIARHTHVSMLAAQGIDYDTISRRLGHSSSNITKKIYMHVTQKLKDRDAEKIQNIKILV